MDKQTYTQSIELSDSQQSYPTSPIDVKHPNRTVPQERNELVMVTESITEV